MSQVILKKSSVAGKVPVAGDLVYGEVALNYADGLLYFKTNTNSIGIIGGAGSITNTQTSNWNSAYNWGNHALAGYLTSISSAQVTSALGFTPYNATNPSGFTSNTGTVTSVLVTVPTGLTATNTAITTSGTIAIGLATGYAIPTTTSQTNWDTAYTDRNKWDGGSIGLNASTARTSLGLVVGTNVQAWDADLDAIAALATNSGFLKKTSANTWALDTNTYLTSYTETDTLATVTARGASTSTAITLNTGNNLISTATWEKLKLVTTGVTAAARQGSDGNGLNFTSNALFNAAWSNDDTTKKSMAYIQHLGNGRHEFRTAPAGASIAWVTSLAVDELGATVTGKLVVSSDASVSSRLQFTSANAFSGGLYAIVGIGPTGEAAGTYRHFAVYDYINSRSMFEVYGDTRSIKLFGGIVTDIANGTMLSNGAMTDAIGWNASYGMYLGSTIGGTKYLYGNGSFFDGNANRTLVHSGNYTSYSPSLTGSGASGTWNILSYGVRFQDTRSVNDLPNAKAAYSLSADFKENAAAGYPPVSSGSGYSHIVSVSGWDNGGSGGWVSQLSVGNGVAVRQATSATVWGAWKTLLDSSNYNNYALPLTGGTVTGIVRINNKLQAGSNTNGTAYIDAYGGYAYYGADSYTTGMRIDSSGNANFTGALTQGGNQVLHAGNYNNYTVSTSSTVIGSMLYAKVNARSTSYTASIIQLATADNTPPSIGFHREGYSATSLYESDGELYAQAWTTRAQTGKLISSGNYQNYALPLSGGSLTGTLNLSTGGDIAWFGGYGSNKSTIGSGGSSITFYPTGASGGGVLTVSATSVYTSQPFSAPNMPRAANNNLVYYAGFTLDANTMPTNSTGFTYGVNAPYVGPIADFSTGGGYDLQLNAQYNGIGSGIAYRTRNGDSGAWNGWYVLLNSSTYPSYSTFAGKVTSGGNNGFANDVFYVGVRNPIWSFGNASSYGISYFQGASGYGGVDTISLHPNGTATADGAAFSVTSAGNARFLGGVTAVAAAQGAYLGVTSNNGGGNGLSLYNGSTSGQPTYGIMFATTGNYGTHGSVTADWATYFTMDSTANRGWVFRNTTTGNVASINNSGTAVFNGGVAGFSDERVKTNWKVPASNFLQELAKVKSGTYDRTDQELTQDGVSAQSLRKVLPYSVLEDNEGNLSVTYGNAALVAAIELAKANLELQKRIARLEALVEKLIEG